MDNEQLEQYLNQDWTFIFGEDKGYTGRTYQYLEIKEFPNFIYCAPTKEILLENYKKQLRLTVKVMLEYGEKLPSPGDIPED